MARASTLDRLFSAAIVSSKVLVNYKIKGTTSILVFHIMSSNSIDFLDILHQSFTNQPT
jgi:hypothetical protein